MRGCTPQVAWYAGSRGGLDTRAATRPGVAVGDVSAITSRFSWEWALLESDLHSTTRLVGLVFSCHVPRRGLAAFPSVGTLAEEANVSKTTVRKHLKELLDKGWLVFDGWEVHSTTGGPQKTKRYRLTVPEVFVEKMNEGGSATDAPSSKGGQLVGKGGQMSGQGGSAADPKQSSNREGTVSGRPPARGNSSSNGDKPRHAGPGDIVRLTRTCPTCEERLHRKGPGLYCGVCADWVAEEAAG